MEVKYLHQPLLAPTTTTSAAAADEHDADNNIQALSSNTSLIIIRLLSVIFIGAISIWANHEASKGFDLTIINEAKESPAGKRFELFYISNDKATRIVLNTSSFVENILYPHTKINMTKKEVQHITLRLTAAATTTMTQRFTVDTTKSSEFVINISSSIMGDANVNFEIISALQRSMARIWLWDGQSRAPAPLIDGFVEYISVLAGFGQQAENFVGGVLPEFSHICWDNKDPRAAARFLDFCEMRNKGFIQRLNQGLRQRWDNRTVDYALGMEAKYLCDSYKNLP